jgi:hypothetical protein
VVYQKVNSGKQTWPKKLCYFHIYIYIYRLYYFFNFFLLPC